jgi:fatty acid desaturase
MLTKEQYDGIRAQLSFDPSSWLAVGSVAMNLATLAGGIAVLQVDHVAAFVAAQVLLAIGFFQSFAILHECGHESFSRSKWLNTAVGHVMSVFCFIPYWGWKYIHQQHHVWAGHSEKDPAVKNLHLWRSTGRVPTFAKVAWRSWVPVVALSQLVVFATYPLALRAPDERPKRIRCAGSVAFMAVAFGIIAAAVLVTGLTFNVLPALVLYLFITELVNLPHHADFPGHGRKLAVREQHVIARSCVYPPVVSEVLMLNFNLHTEHHLFPKLPWYRLKKARRLAKPLLGDAYHERIGIGWNVEHRTRDLEDVLLVTSRE